jgi:hypothetical protein
MQHGSLYVTMDLSLWYTPPIMGKTNVIELDDANEIIIREAFRRLGPNARHNTVRLQEQIEEVAKEQAETIYAHLSDAAREQLRRSGLRISEQIARLARINEAIDYGHFLIAKFKVKTLGELPQEEQREFARLWMAATGGAKPKEN